MSFDMASPLPGASGEVSFIGAIAFSLVNDRIYIILFLRGILVSMARLVFLFHLALTLVRGSIEWVLCLPF